MPHRLAAIYRHASASLAVLAMGVALSAAGAYLVAGQVARQARLKFDAEVGDAQAAIASRVRAYADLLLGIRGLFIAENSVGRDEFRRYVESLDLSHRYPVKIDRSFVQDLPGDADVAAITRAIIAMAHGLRLKVIAEGVETEEQLNFLREQECDEMQGYLFSRPLPEDEFVGLLEGVVDSGGEPAQRRA